MLGAVETRLVGPVAAGVLQQNEAMVVAIANYPMPAQETSESGTIDWEARMHEEVQEGPQVH